MCMYLSLIYIYIYIYIHVYSPWRRQRRSPPRSDGRNLGGGPAGLQYICIYTYSPSRYWIEVNTVYMHVLEH